MAKDRVDTSNSAKRLPIVFCLDVSPSMRNGKPTPRITLLNTAVRSFINELKSNAVAAVSAEIAFVTFSDKIETETAFECVGTLRVPEFATVRESSTKMAEALLRCIEKIEVHRENLMNAEIPYYAPFLVLITDGNPDDNDDPRRLMQAKQEVVKHCSSHVGAEEIIVPFIIGVGTDIGVKTLNDLSKGFIDGFFHIKDNSQYTNLQFNNVFKLISNSVIGSCTLNKSHEENIQQIKEGMDLMRKTYSLDEMYKELEGF